jgi:acetyl-CoA carboxylase beta subunit
MTMNTKKTQREAVVLHRLVRRDLWNKCDVCGKIISYADLESGKAIHNMKTPDSEVSFETWETLCRDHYQPNAERSREGTPKPTE